MKLFIQAITIILVSLTASIPLLSQKSGVINYIEITKLEMKISGEEGVDLSGMFPTSQTIHNQVFFDKKVSLQIESKEIEKESMNFSSDDGEIKIMIMDSGVEEIIYSDYKTKTRIDQKGFMGKAFLVEEKLGKSPWKITTEKLNYLEYECMKATMINSDSLEVVAWFAPAIPVQIGPSIYGQLPGAILMLSIDGDKTEIKATKIELKEIDEIEKPEDGKKVSEEEYNVIVEEKMKEMMESHGKGGTMFEIKG